MYQLFRRIPTHVRGCLWTMSERYLFVFQSILDVFGRCRTVIWCRLQESNPRPTDYKSVALPAELNRRPAIDRTGGLAGI